MGVLITVPEMQLKYKDVFQLRNFYVMFHQFLLEEGWFGLEGDPEHKDLESFYSENIYQKGGHLGGKEMWVYWRTWRYPFDRDSGYFRYEMDIDMHMSYVQDIEVVHQGKKMKAQNGEIELYIRPRLISDYKGEWDKHWLLKHLKHIYEHRILHGEIVKMEKELWRFSGFVQHKAKQYFELRGHMQMPEPLWHKKWGFD